MKLTRALITGGLAAGGMVLAMASPAFAGDCCCDDDDDHHKSVWKQHNEIKYDNDFVDIL
jgi:hypothetical protein